MRHSHAPMRLDSKGHALARFIERWWPFTEDEKRLRNPAKKKAATDLRLATLMDAVRTDAFPIEFIPDERQSIWGFVMYYGPHCGETALLVVSDDGTVRTVLPSGAKKPAARRGPRSPTTPNRHRAQ